MIEGIDKTLKTVILNVNDQQRVVNIKSSQTLLDVLRNLLNIKSIKAACWAGDCGVCTVLLDGIPVKSCLVLANEAVNHDILTVEGISEGEKISQLQNVFIKNGAVQCGFCTGAFLLMGHYILSRKKKVTFNEIQHLINGIICRCTGYKEIVQSIYEVNEQQFP